MVLPLTVGAGAQGSAQGSVQPPHGGLLALVAGVGGMLPTLSRMGASYAVDPGQPLPEFGLYLSLLIFFIIGGFMALTLSEGTLRDALVIGISAPAIITNIASGTHEKKDPPTNPPTESRKLVDPDTLRPSEPGPGAWNATGHAYAAERPDDPVATPPDATSLQKPAEQPWTPLRPDRLFGARKVVLALDVRGRATDRAVVQLRFFDEGGYNVGEVTLIAGQPGNQILSAPISARGFLLEAAASKEAARLPKDAFDEAVYDVQLTVKPGTDLLWGLGAPRTDTVEELRVQQKSVTTRVPLTGAISSSSTRYAFGVDLSHFQKQVDWNALARGGIRFAIVRATYGTTPDKNVDQFWSTYRATADSSRMAIGFYHFFRFGQAADEQAIAFVERVRGKTAERMLPPTVSLGLNTYDPPITGPPDAARYFEGVRRFIAIAEEKLGRRLIVLVDPALAKQGWTPPDIAERSLWVKDFSGVTPTSLGANQNYRLWLFGTGLIPGVDSVVDLNVFNGDLDAFARFSAGQL